MAHMLVGVTITLQSLLLGKKGLFCLLGFDNIDHIFKVTDRLLIPALTDTKTEVFLVPMPLQNRPVLTMVSYGQITLVN